MSNLACEAPDALGQMLRFPKDERRVMSDTGEECYTPLPNFICDEGYLAVLDSEAIKCLIFLIRHINGFHLKSKGMSEALIQKITGIKDSRTIQKYMHQLTKYKLIEIEKKNGKSNVYSLSFEGRLPTSYGGASKGSEKQPPTSYAGIPPPHDVGAFEAPPTQHVPTTPHMACGSVKEIYLKEDEEEDAREENKKFTAQNRSMQFVEYYTKDRLPISLKDLFKKYPAQIDFQDQAKISFPNHSHEQIFTELQKLGQWSLSASNLTPQKWMSVWLDWMRKVPTLAEVATAAERQKQSIQKPQKPKYHQYGQEPATPSIRDVGGSHE